MWPYKKNKDQREETIYRIPFQKEHTLSDNQTEIIQKNDISGKNVIIAGCGSLVSLLMPILKDSIITVVDSNVNCLSDDDKQNVELFMLGDVTDSSVLAHAGINSADILIAATNNDNANIMISDIAKSYYNVKVVIAWINDSSKIGLIEKLGGVCLCPDILCREKLRSILI